MEEGLTCSLCDKEITLTSERYEKIKERLGPAALNVCIKCFYKIDKKRLKEYTRGICLKEKYGITEIEYKEILARQGYGCKICGNKPRKRPLAVDHDHVTGRIRGLLCTRCNLMLGYAKDNIKTLEAGIIYLRGENSSPRTLQDGVLLKTCPLNSRNIP